MGYSIAQRGRRAWALARWQHGVIARWQLIELGFSPQSIKHRIATGRLHPVRTGVYAVGRRELSDQGRWMAAVLSCGPHAVLSHDSAAALWGFRPPRLDEIEVSVPLRVVRRRSGIIVHRRANLGAADLTTHHSIPVTTPVCTLVDIATSLERGQLEGAINEADRLNLIDPERLRSALLDLPRRPGLAILREMLDRRTFTLTDSELERRFLPLARDAGLAPPLTGRRVNGFKVDFGWPDLRLVVETDGLRYHRTPAQQAKDRVRDQTHTAAGLTTLRFTYAQVCFEPGRVRATLARTAGRLSERSGPLRTGSTA
jgi:very-short-patch-repair endonuclease